MKRFVLAILFMLVPAVCSAESVNGAMNALKHLESITMNGTSYKDYAVFLREAKSEVGLYLKGDEAKRNIKLKDAISEALDLYEYADSFFIKMDQSKGFINIDTDASPADKKIADEYFSRFPEEKKDVAAGGVLKNQQGFKLQIKAAVANIFKRASKKYAEAVNLQK